MLVLLLGVCGWMALEFPCYSAIQLSSQQRPGWKICCRKPRKTLSIIHTKGGVLRVLRGKEKRPAPAVDKPVGWRQPSLALCPHWPNENMDKVTFLVLTLKLYGKKYVFSEHGILKKS